jgi:endonuclease-8
MSRRWNTGNALEKLKHHASALACDVLLDQNIFAGSGNIIKNETLFRAKIHPKSIVGKIPLRVKKTLVKELITYGKLFLKWRRHNVLKRHWEAYAKKICPRDGTPLKIEITGKSRRRSFYCRTCQKIYK